jgi:hypothetical protein
MVEMVAVVQAGELVGGENGLLDEETAVTLT